MRTNQSVRAGGLLGALAACMVLGGAAQAQVATERPGSILVFPKVVRDAERDTIIHITNTGNMVNNLRCFYVTGNTCRSTDFEVSLTRQQPTHWRASTGRFVTLADPFGSDGAGLDPGLIPPVPMDFEGALVCAEVNSDGMPVAQNKLKGEASILALGGDISRSSKYNAIAIAGGSGLNDNNNELFLDGSEYAACPAVHRVNFMPDGQGDLVLGAGADASTFVTAMPCDLDIENGVPGSTILSFSGWDEFEVAFSGSMAVDCWSNFELDSVFGAIFTQFATVRVATTAGAPVVMIAETVHDDGAGNIATRANNVHAEGDDASGLIRLSHH